MSRQLSVPGRWWRWAVDVGVAVANFRWRQGQKHYSGTYWSATEKDHVVYESRLELARLLFADFDVSVRRIVAQPFLLRAVVAGAVRKHIPDYLLFTDAVAMVVDVKPRHRASKPANAFTFTWTRRAAEARGWRYELWSEPPSVELENVRFLAGYRRDRLFDRGLLDALRALDLDGATLGAALRALPALPDLLVRSAVLHLLWQQYFRVDLTRPLGAGARVEEGLVSVAMVQVGGGGAFPLPRRGDGVGGDAEHHGGQRGRAQERHEPPDHACVGAGTAGFG